MALERTAPGTLRPSPPGAASPAEPDVRNVSATLKPMGASPTPPSIAHQPPRRTRPHIEQRAAGSLRRFFPAIRAGYDAPPWAFVSDLTVVGNGSRASA